LLDFNQLVLALGFSLRLLAGGQVFLKLGIAHVD
jgi:hypothetical protein